jgi:hypothetical protein
MEEAKVTETEGKKPSWYRLIMTMIGTLAVLALGITWLAMMAKESQDSDKGYERAQNEAKGKAHTGDIIYHGDKIWMVVARSTLNVKNGLGEELNLQRLKVGSINPEGEVTLRLSDETMSTNFMESIHLYQKIHGRR